jgi:hypothetical protein
MAIIGVSGYSGVGKDTVGAIIQYLNCPNVGGKSVEEVCKNYEEHEWWLDEQSDWEIRKFAGKLKDIASHITGIDIEDFEDQEFKKTNLGREWWTLDYIKRYAEPFPTDDSIPVEITEVLNPMTVRDFLQKLGTDALRNGLHPNIWVNALMVDYIEEESNWIITDTRFENEAIAIKNKGGIIIRVDRPGIRPINDHPSEVGLDHWNFDYKVQNIDDIFYYFFDILIIYNQV